MAVSHVLYLNGGRPFPTSTVRTVVTTRPPNTNAFGEPFEETTINAVWEKARKEFGFYFYRRDICEAVIAKHEYGKRTKYGWEIDHIVPVSAGGTDDIDNLQPLHWENNVSKGDSHPNWACMVKE